MKILGSPQVSLGREFQCDRHPACCLHWSQPLESGWPAAGTHGTHAAGTGTGGTGWGEQHPHSPYLMRESTLQHAVPGDFTQVTGAQLPHLSRNCVFFHKGFLDPPKVKVLDGRLSLSILRVSPKLETSDRRCRFDSSFMSGTRITEQHSHPTPPPVSDELLRAFLANSQVPEEIYRNAYVSIR